MTSKAISKIYKCNPAKKPLDGNEYIQVDIDRLIGYMKSEIKNIDSILSDKTELEIEGVIETELLRQKDFYEGMLGTIAANSFK